MKDIRVVKMLGESNEGEVYVVQKSFKSARGKMYHLQNLEGKNKMNVPESEIKKEKR